MISPSTSLEDKRFCVGPCFSTSLLGVRDQACLGTPAVSFRVATVGRDLPQR